MQLTKKKKGMKLDFIYQLLIDFKQTDQVYCDVNDLYYIKAVKQKRKK